MYFSANQKKQLSPIESLNGMKTDISHLKQFRCKSFVEIQKEKMVGEKLGEGDEEGFSFGYIAGKSYNIYTATTYHFRIKTYVHLMEM